MTKNDIKTVLFASLIVAMILPFSMMDYADAQTNADNTTKNELEIVTSKMIKVSKKIEKISERIERATNPAIIHVLEMKKQTLITKYNELEIEAIPLVEEYRKTQLDTLDSQSIFDNANTKGTLETASVIESDTCYGLINVASSCDSTMHIEDKEPFLEQPVSAYTVQSCVDGLKGTCADFIFSASDVPGSYYKDENIFFFKQGGTNTCVAEEKICSTVASTERGWDGKLRNMGMLNAPTGKHTATTWVFYYEATPWFQDVIPDYHSFVQYMPDGYNPTG